jgi:hypothetical protein
MFRILKIILSFVGTEVWLHRRHLIFKQEPMLAPARRGRGGSLGRPGMHQDTARLGERLLPSGNGLLLASGDSHKLIQKFTHVIFDAGFTCSLNQHASILARVRIPPALTTLFSRPLSWILVTLTSETLSGNTLYLQPHVVTQYHHHMNRSYIMMLTGWCYMTWYVLTHAGMFWQCAMFSEGASLM